MEKRRILVVDDQPAILRMLDVGLSQEGFEVLSASSGAEAIATAQEEGPDAVVLDLIMPDLDGFEVCRRIRAFSSIPILMLTGLRNEGDIVHGLDVGADEYMTKPFSINELSARLRALLRRVSALQTEPIVHSIACDNGRVVVDFDRRIVINDGAHVPLSDTEFRLLSYLIANAGRVVSHARIIEHVWGSDRVSQTSYLRTYVGLLRRKLERDPQHPTIITSSHGVGYCLKVDEPSAASKIATEA